MTSEDENKRQAVLKEIISTENSYRQHLRTCHAIYVTPISQNKFLKSQDFSYLFSGIDVISNVSQELLSQLKEHDSNVKQLKDGDKPKKPIGEIFVQTAPMFKMYTTYYQRYDSIISKLRHLRKTNSSFAKFLNETERIAKQNQLLELAQYLAMPIQRIPRYSLLLRELIKYTDPEDKDYNNLCQALEETKKVANYMNSKVADNESQNKVAVLSRKIKDLDDHLELVAPSRRFVRQGKLSEVDDDRKTENVYLFSDIILWTRTARLGTAERYRGHAKLAISPMPTVRESEELDHTFELLFHNSILRFECSSNAERDEWINTLINTLEKLKTSQSLQLTIETDPVKRQHRRSSTPSNDISAALSSSSGLSAGGDLVAKGTKGKRRKSPKFWSGVSGSFTASPTRSSNQREGDRDSGDYTDTSDSNGGDHNVDEENNDDIDKTKTKDNSIDKDMDINASSTSTSSHFPDTTPTPQQDQEERSSPDDNQEKNDENNSGDQTSVPESLSLSSSSQRSEDKQLSIETKASHDDNHDNHHAIDSPQIVVDGSTDETVENESELEPDYTQQDTHSHVEEPAEGFVDKLLSTWEGMGIVENQRGTHKHHPNHLRNQSHRRLYEQHQQGQHNQKTQEQQQKEHHQSTPQNHPSSSSTPSRTSPPTPVSTPSPPSLSPQSSPSTPRVNPYHDTEDAEDAAPWMRELSKKFGQKKFSSVHRNSMM